MTVKLSGSPQAVDLGEGYAIRAPGISGTAEVRRPRSAADRLRTRSLDDGSDELNAAFATAGITEVRQIDLTLQKSTPAVAAKVLRSVDGQDQIELQVPDLGPEAGQVVLACDETGVLTWHFPVDDQQRIQSPATRGAGGKKHFLIPASRPAPVAAPFAAKRSILGVLGKKLLKVLVYPLLDPVIGAVSEYFAGEWEKKRRPYGLRNFTPSNFREEIVGPALQAADWQRLASGRALLFIHGTFSTAHSAFSQIPDAIFGDLYQRYGERVFAFNHFTLSQDPRENVKWFLEQLPPNITLDLDIVCHSRGGLVARTLAERPSAFGLATTRVAVKRVVFVGVPNNGTLLAHPDHMVKMLDRFTSALNIFPTGPVGDTLEAIISVVKVVGHGALKGLDGLAAMQSDGDFIKTLNQGKPAEVEYYSVSADYEPVDEGLKALVTGSITDAVMDRVFGQVPNDLVVPEPGVYGSNGCASFPIDVSHRLQVAADAGIIHTTLFGYAPTNEKMVEWLSG